MNFGLPPDVHHWAEFMLGNGPEPAKLEARPEGSNHGSDSPDLDDERLRIEYSHEEVLQTLEEQEAEYHERYLSSEEDLSPMEEDFDDSDSFHSFEMDDDLELDKAIEAYSSDEEWRAELAATTVSIVFTGRPKVVDVLPTPATSPVTAEIPSRDSSLNANLNNGVKPRPLDRGNRVSFDYAASSNSRSDSASSKSHRTLSSFYSLTAPSSPAFFNSDRRISVSGSERVRSYSPTTPTVPETPVTVSSPESDTQVTPKHARLKGGLQRLGLFRQGKKNHKERKDSFTSGSTVPLSQPTASMFEPPPFVRPQVAKLVARGADERESTVEMAAIFGGSRASYAVAEPSLSEDGGSHNDSDNLVRSKLSKRRSLMGL